jgi:predicted lipid-binding transport protein (Tim44 family)
MANPDEQMSSSAAPDLTEIYTVDPTFDITSFLSYATDTYLNVRAAWKSGDLSPIRSRLSATLFSHMTQQLEFARTQGHHPEVITAYELNPAVIAGTLDEEGASRIPVRFTVYGTIEDIDLTLGHPQNPISQSWTETWVFTSTNSGSIPHQFHCPNCSELVALPPLECGNCHSLVDLAGSIPYRVSRIEVLG